MSLMLKRILNTKWIILFLLFSMFTPLYLDQNSTFDVVFTVIESAVAVIVSLLYFFTVKKHIRKLFNILLYIFCGNMLLSTILSKDAQLYGYASIIIGIIAPCFLIELLMIYSPYNGLKSMYIYFTACTLINTATVFIFPGAMYPNNGGNWVCWFLGEDNFAYMYYIIASTVAMLYCYYIVKKITIVAFLDWMSAFIFVFHNQIATGIICQIVWLLLVVGYQFKWFKKMIKARYVLYFLISGFLCLVMFRKFIFSWIIEAVGRDITLTGRTNVWDRTIQLLMKRPVFGYGITTGDKYADLIGRKGVLMAHDWLLILGYNGGILAIILYIMQIIAAGREARLFRNTDYYRCIVIGLIILYFRSLVEGGDWACYFVLLAMLDYSKEFLNGILSFDVPRKRLIGIKHTIKYKFTIGGLKS